MSLGLFQSFFLKVKDMFSLSLCMCLSEACGCLWRPEEGVGFSGLVGVRYPAWVLGAAFGF